MSYIEKLTAEELAAIKDEAEFKALVTYRLGIVERHSGDHETRLRSVERKAAGIATLVSLLVATIGQLFKGGSH